jgi:hypothetical protein
MKEKVLEISAVKLNTCSLNLTLCCVYRSPSVKPKYFLELLEKTLRSLYQPNVSLVICGDLNINFLVNSTMKLNLESIMKTFNLTQAVTFPKRICKDKGTLIDSIFLDTTKFNNISVHPFDSGLSDHMAQILTLGDVRVPPSKCAYTKETKLMDIIQ